MKAFIDFLASVNPFPKETLSIILRSMVLAATLKFYWLEKRGERKRRRMIATIMRERVDFTMHIVTVGMAVVMKIRNI